MNFDNFMNSLLTNLISPPKSKLTKIFSLKFMFKKVSLFQYVMDSFKWELKILKVRLCRI